MKRETIIVEDTSHLLNRCTHTRRKRSSICQLSNYRVAVLHGYVFLGETSETRHTLSVLLFVCHMSKELLKLTILVEHRNSSS